MHLTEGRPKDLSGRTAREIRVYDLLDELNISYEYVDHEPMRSMQDCLEVDSILNAAICKNLFLCNRQATEFYLLLIPGDKPFKTKYLSAQIGSSRLSFAKPEAMQEYLDITPGSVSVMGLMNDRDNRVQLLIDGDVLKAGYFACHPCINTSSLRFRTGDLMDKVIPAMGHEPKIVEL